MPKTIAVVQSSYIPWKGYFDLIASVDEFVLYDDVQYTTRDWRNRNRIKTPQGVAWLTIPVAAGSRDRLVQDVEVSDRGWAAEHWRVISHAYGRAACFREMKPLVEELYLGCDLANLSAINHRFLSAFLRILWIGTPLTRSADYAPSGVRTERLLSICRAAGATTYVSGPTARTYLDERAFAEAGVTLRYFDYDGYPEYRQPYPPFEHAVSIVDLVLCEGAEARHLLKRVSPCGSRS